MSWSDPDDLPGMGTFDRGVRNGMPEFRPYVYRGTGKDTITPFIREGKKNDRLTVLDETTPVMSRGRPARRKQHEGAAGTESEFVVCYDPPARCEDCGYRVSAPGHLVACEIDPRFAYDYHRMMFDRAYLQGLSHIITCADDEHECGAPA